VTNLHGLTPCAITAHCTTAECIIMSNRHQRRTDLRSFKREPHNARPGVTHLVDAERAPRRSSAIVQGAWRSNISSGVSIVLQARPAFLRALRRCCSSAYRAVLQGRLSDPWEAFSPIIATATDQPN